MHMHSAIIMHMIVLVICTLVRQNSYISVSDMAHTLTYDDVTAQYMTDDVFCDVYSGVHICSTAL